MKQNDSALKDEIIANINYWQHIVEDAEARGDSSLQSLAIDETNMTKAFSAGIGTPQTFDLSIDLLCQIGRSRTVQMNEEDDSGHVC